MAAPKAASAPTRASGLPVELILNALPAELVQQAVALAIAQMDLTPQKLADILTRHFNPDEIIEKGREAKLRGVKTDTLRGYKEEGFFPEFVNGAPPSRVKNG